MNYLTVLIKEENEINLPQLDWPSNTAMKFVNFEREINEDPIKKSVFVNELRKINGTTLENYIRKCLQKMLTNRAARRLAFFAWHKRGRMIAVEKYKVLEILLDEALTKFPKSLKYDVIQIFVKWFEFA